MADFPLTHWTMVARLCSQDEGQRQRAFTELCEGYWHPLYAFARSLGNSPEDAADATQDFMVKLLTKDSRTFENLVPERGQLRTWLRSAFRNHLINHHRDRTSGRRGGGMIHQSLDLQALEEEFVTYAQAHNPDDAFDRVWMRDMLRRAMEKLQIKHEARGRGDFVRQLEPHLAELKGVSMVALATRLGIRENALRTALHRLRREYGEILRAEVSDTLPEGADVDAELRYLMTLAG